MTPEPIDIETLMAFADGALPPDEAARVARLLEHDAAARAQVEQLRHSAAVARQALDADLAQPVPAALQRSVQAAIERARARQAAAETPPPAPAPMVPQRAAARAPRRGWLAALGLDLQPRFAFAAGLTTVAAGVVGYVIGTAQPQGAMTSPAGLLVASADEYAALTRVLDAAPSGERRALATGGEVELMASFRSGGGALCREFKLARRAGSGYLAVACRDAQQWTVQVASATSTAGGYAPAAARTAALDAFITSIGGGAPLSREEEARALAGR